MESASAFVLTAVAISAFVNVRRFEDNIFVPLWCAGWLTLVGAIVAAGPIESSYEPWWIGNCCVNVAAVWQDLRPLLYVVVALGLWRAFLYRRSFARP